jgi:hypothetical protein
LENPHLWGTGVLQSDMGFLINFSIAISYLKYVCYRGHGCAKQNLLVMKQGILFFLKKKHLLNTHIWTLVSFTKQIKESKTELN